MEENEGMRKAESEEPDLASIIEALGDHTTHPDRPFTGQPHTDNGERGKTMVKGIRFRDMADCCVKAIVDATPGTPDELRRRADDGTLNWNDLYTLDLSEVDPIAIVQALTCRVEMAMGIFPNVPGLQGREDL